MHERARDQARCGLYVHVPFCATRCTYCDFSSGRLSAAAVERYLAGIEREVELRAPGAAGLTFTSVFFGGGTPSALAPRHFERLWAAVSRCGTIERGAEITLEANPETVKPALLEAWAKAGVNRLSMGAQSFHADELAGLGRIHSADRPAEALELARAHGFRRLSLDLMFGFPGSTHERFSATVERALGTGLDHLSAYCFIPEAGTPMGDAALAGKAELPGAAAQAAMYRQLTRRAAAAGLHAYETSNFCRDGEEARHNLVYWLRRPYLALGPSAHGYLGGERYANHYSLPRWASALEQGAAPESEREADTPCSIAEEILMLGLRLGAGLRAADHAPDEWATFQAAYGDAIERALAVGRLERAGGFVRIPRRHRFVADDVIAWIAACPARDVVDRDSTRSLPSSPCPSLPSPGI